ncbi:GTP-binding protein [Patescibacteria group bacterium]|nr:GTP-binding protein [Patescibacteria group bacterium]
MKRIPVTILTGFLGAGKTTLLNRLLKENAGRKFAVVVNEFGDAGIDGALLDGAQNGMVEISGGAVCCAAMGDVAQAMATLMASNKDFERVIIETTGLADPLPLAKAFLNRPSLEKHFQLDAIVTLVDATTIAQRLLDTVEAEQQIATADVVIITKLDAPNASPAATVRELVAELNPAAVVAEAVRGAIDPAILLDADLPALENRPHAKLTGHGHQHSDITSVHLKTTKPLELAKVSRFIGEHLVANGDRLLRYKGVFFIADRAERFVFQGVQFDFELLPDRPWREDEEKRSDLVLIGTNITSAEFTPAFTECEQ